MKRIKRFLSVLMSMTWMVVLFAGCVDTTGTVTSENTETSVTAEASETELTSPLPESSKTAEEVELYISAAASLTDVLQEIADAYKETAPNVTLTFTFDSSGTLQTQIEEGAPADLFISAAQKQMDTLEGEGLIIADTRIDLLENRVVLIVPAGSDSTITSFEDVGTDAVSMVAIGGESVPVGQYTEQVFTSLGIWEDVQAKANYGENVRAVLAWVESGDAECGVVYATDAASTDDVTVVCEAPEGSCDQVIYPAVLIEGTQYQEEAQAFLDFLTGYNASTLFEKAGFVMAK